MFLVEVLHMVASATSRIWSAGSLDQFIALSVSWAAGTTILFLPFYAAAWILPGLAGGKKPPGWVVKVRGWIVAAHTATFLAPLLIVPGLCCVAPCAILFWVARAAWCSRHPQPQRQPRRRPTPRPRRDVEDDDDEDEDSDGEDDTDP